MKTERKLERGCVVFMTSDSGIKGYGNEQCVKSVSHELGELSLFGHNECCKTYHVREIVSFPDQFTQPAGVAPPVSNEAIETVHEKSLRLIREFLKNEPQEVKRIIKEVEDMEFEGPTVEEYFNSVGYEDSRTHEVKGYSRDEVDAIKDVLIKSKGALEYAAFNYDGSKLENLRPGLLDSTGVSDSCLISVREINHLLSSLPTPSTDEQQ